MFKNYFLKDYKLNFIYYIFLIEYIFDSVSIMFWKMNSHITYPSIKAGKPKLKCNFHVVCREFKVNPMRIAFFLTAPMRRAGSYPW